MMTSLKNIEEIVKKTWQTINSDLGRECKSINIPDTFVNRSSLNIPDTFVNRSSLNIPDTL